MSDPELEEDFPGLQSSPYEKKSDPDLKYNCIAFVVGDITQWWEDVPGDYWPPNTPSSDSLEGWIKVFRDHGYSETEDRSLEPDYEKIAIYASSEEPMHVARQKASGVWTSKLGQGKDIEHATLEALEGDLYGRVARIMKRRCQGGGRVLE